MKRVSVKLMEGLCGKRNVFKLDKTHWTILLGSEAKAFVSTLLGEHRLELVFGCVDGKITNVKSVAGRVLIGGIDGGKVVSLVMLAPKLIVRWGATISQGSWRQRNRV